jgi:PilZ domain
MRVDARLVLESGERCECALSDVSDRGARINVHDSEIIPDNFLLLLAENGAAQRRCRVIWRKPRELGVKFETWLDERVRAARAPKSGADGNAASKKAEPAASDA